MKRAMKYVSSTALATLLLFALQGCDIAADVRIGGTPVNSGGNPLDPEDDFNIQAYFYTDRPVEGLRFVCTGSAMTPVSGKTDENGGFVCPRASRATFYVGDPNGLSLGAVDLKIFGNRAPVADDGSNSGEADARENVAITPLTLYGTTWSSTVGCSPDPRYCQVANVFQLLYLLDTSVAGANRQDRLIVSPAMHAAISSFAPSMVLNQTPDNFKASYELLIADAASDAGITLRSGGVGLNPSAALPDLVKRSVRAQRAGLYRFAPPILGFDNADVTAVTYAFRGTMAMLVGRNGQTSGIGYSWETDFLLSQHYFDTMSLTPGSGATLDPGGLLTNIVFTSAENGDFTVTGRMVNDRLFGDVSLLDPANSANYRIPYTYGYSTADVGEFTEGLIQDHVTLYRQLEGLPDVEMDLLDPGYLPREFGLLYQDYPDGTLVTDVQRADLTGYGGVAKPLRFRILPNGDIVSVTYGYNCDQPGFSEVTDVAGQYQRGDGTHEAVIGQVGSVFETVTGSLRKRYMTIALAVYDPTHADHGFQFGTAALDGVALDPVVIDIDNVNGPQLLNKFCDPAVADCDGYLEWFNTIRFYEDVVEFLVVNDLPQNDPAAATYLRKPGYFGRVSGFQEFCP